MKDNGKKEHTVEPTCLHFGTKSATAVASSMHKTMTANMRSHGLVVPNVFERTLINWSIDVNLPIIEIPRTTEIQRDSPTSNLDLNK
jgi:hypothetical protein